MTSFSYPDVWLDDHYVEPDGEFGIAKSVFWEDNGAYRYIVCDSLLKEPVGPKTRVTEFSGSGDAIAAIVPAGEGVAIRVETIDFDLRIGFRDDCMYIGYADQLGYLKCERIRPLHGAFK